jgi:hypothetical protein
MVPQKKGLNRTSSWLIFLLAIRFIFAYSQAWFDRERRRRGDPERPAPRWLWLAFWPSLLVKSATRFLNRLHT